MEGLTEIPTQPTLAPLHSGHAAPSSIAPLRMAAVAHKLQIPRMDTFAPTKCAFAPITHGIALKVFESNLASQLIYAEQVATAIYKRKGSEK